MANTRAVRYLCVCNALQSIGGVSTGIRSRGRHFAYDERTAHESRGRCPAARACARAPRLARRRPFCRAREAAGVVLLHGKKTNALQRHLHRSARRGRIERKNPVQRFKNRSAESQFLHDRGDQNSRECNHQKCRTVRMQGQTDQRLIRILHPAEFCALCQNRGDQHHHKEQQRREFQNPQYFPFCELLESEIPPCHSKRPSGQQIRQCRRQQQSSLSRDHREDHPDERRQLRRNPPDRSGRQRQKRNAQYQCARCIDSSPGRHPGDGSFPVVRPQGSDPSL